MKHREYPASTEQPHLRPVPIWDLPTRLFHWSIAIGVLVSYMTNDLNMIRLHALTGEALLALLLFRILWGIWGSDTALFGRFLSYPGTAVRHLRHIHHPEPDFQVGHNPAGGWMVLLLLSLMLALGLTGLYAYNDVARVGALTQFVPWQIGAKIPILHATLFKLLLGAIGLHIVSVTIYSKLKKQDLVRPMLTGEKNLPNSLPAPRFASNVRALLLLLGAAAAVAIASLYL